MGCSSIPREISLFWWSKMANHHAYIPDWKGKTKGKSLPCRDRPSESGACHFTETVHTRTWFNAAPTRVPEGIFILKSLVLGDRYWNIMKSLPQLTSWGWHTPHWGNEHAGVNVLFFYTWARRISENFSSLLGALTLAIPAPQTL